MPLLHIVVVALIQGITEFLPISSSGHLILVPVLTGWDDQGVVIDVASHVGTLVAVLIYFRRDVAAMAAGFLALATRRKDEGARLALMIVVATVPTVVAGAALHELGPDLLRGAVIIAWTTLGFGVLLGIADRVGDTTGRMQDIGFAAALAFGLAQVLALVPGTSRSGITMTAGRFLGLGREAAARFSLLMSIPTILGAGTLAGWDLYQAGDVTLGIDAVLAAVLSCLAALAAIALMMRWLRRASFLPFVIYRIVLGLGLLIWLYS